jgi:hypothetical protein
MTRAIAWIVIGCLLPSAGCQPAPPAGTVTPLAPFSARDALLDLLRREPRLFVGSPDPEKLLMMPVVDREDGTYQWGAFTLNLRSHTYTATVGQAPAETYHYSGQFHFERGQWSASQPQVRRFHANR